MALFDTSADNMIWEWWGWEQLGSRSWKRRIRKKLRLIREPRNQTPFTPCEVYCRPTNFSDLARNVNYTVTSQTCISDHRAGLTCIPRYDDRDVHVMLASDGLNNCSFSECYRSVHKYFNDGTIVITESFGDSKYLKTAESCPRHPFEVFIVSVKILFYSSCIAIKWSINPYPNKQTELNRVEMACFNYILNIA